MPSSRLRNLQVGPLFHVTFSARQDLLSILHIRNKNNIKNKNSIQLLQKKKYSTRANQRST